MNYGNHLGNDIVLSIMHDARMQFLSSWGYTELEIGGCGMIMADVMIAYKNEGYYGDVLKVALYADEIGSRSFDLFYDITATRKDAMIEIARAKTGMVAFDYANRKVCTIPAKFLEQLNQAE